MDQRDVDALLVPASLRHRRGSAAERVAFGNSREERAHDAEAARPDKLEQRGGGIMRSEQATGVVIEGTASSIRLVHPRAGRTPDGLVTCTC